MKKMSNLKLLNIKHFILMFPVMNQIKIYMNQNNLLIIQQ